MRGLSNVNYWLKRRGFAADERVARAVLQKAKESNRTLSEEEVLQLVRAETEAARVASPSRA
jgi:hypothetical protein